MDLGETLDVATAKEWRSWLRKHHRTAREVWLVYHPKASGKPSIAYNDAVDEALCFGWIDSTVKSLPAGDRGKPGGRGDPAGGLAGDRAQRFTPRRKTSGISEMNKARVRRLLRERRMTKAGLAALEGIAGAEDLLKPKPVKLAPDVRAALREEPQTWKNFVGMPEDYKRIRLGFIEGARARPKVFATRLRYFVKMTRAKKQYGMVRA